jgi:hypothetical protein
MKEQPTEETNAAPGGEISAKSGASRRTDDAPNSRELLPSDEKANCDDWTKIALHCRECGEQFFRKVKGQRHCDEHRHLAGAEIRPMTEQLHSNPSNDDTIAWFEEMVRRLDKGNYEDRIVLHIYTAKKLLNEIRARSLAEVSNTGGRHQVSTLIDAGSSPAGRASTSDETTERDGWRLLHNAVALWSAADGAGLTELNKILARYNPFDRTGVETPAVLDLCSCPYQSSITSMMIDPICPVHGAAVKAKDDPGCPKCGRQGGRHHDMCPAQL